MAHGGYAPRGEASGSLPAGSDAFSKSVLDGIGRETKRYVGYDTAETNYADAGNVSGDTIFEQVETAYDEASNVVQTTTRRRFHNATGTGELTSPTGTQPKARVSYLAFWCDGIGRQTATANYGTNGGGSFIRPNAAPASSDTVLVSTVEYNTAGEAFKSIDPMCTETRREHDAAGRQTKLIENYVDGNPSTGAADEDRTTQTAYNADGLVSTLTAKNPTTGDQVTTYVYGTTLTDSEIARRDLLRAVIYPDSDDAASPLGNGPDGVYDRVEHGYNRQGQTTQTKDQNETVHAFDFDKLGRPTQDRVTTLGSGVDGTVLRIGRSYEVRGLVERITSYDNATVGSGSVVNEVQMAYNGFQQLVAEYQQHGGAVNISSTPKVQYAYADGSANRARLTGIVYPDGRLLRYEYNSGHDDHLSRVSFLADDNAGGVGTHLAEYAYLGLAVFVKVDYAEPQIRYDLAAGAGDDPYDGLDRFDRVVDLLWRNYGAGADAEHLKYGYDRASNRLWRQNLVSAALTPPVPMDELYAYDGLYQLQDFQRGELNAAKDALVAGTLAFAQQWSFDATGNWNIFKEDDNGSGSWSLDQTRTHSEVNEITGISGGAWIDPAYDRNGNSTTFPQPAAPTAGYSAVYDAWNRLTGLNVGISAIVEYSYDGLGRRNSTTSGTTSRQHYQSSDWQVLEERLDSSTSVDRQFVWGIRYINNCVLREDANHGRIYALQTAKWSCTAIADALGQVLERYAYEAYGVGVVMAPTFGSRTASAFDWELRFAGYHWDSTCGLYDVRFRALDASLGRWLCRDPLGSSIDEPNLYCYALNSPVVRFDPYGLQSEAYLPGVTHQQEQIRRLLGLLIGGGGAAALNALRVLLMAIPTAGWIIGGATVLVILCLRRGWPICLAENTKCVAVNWARQVPACVGRECAPGYGRTARFNDGDAQAACERRWRAKFLNACYWRWLGCVFSCGTLFPAVVLPCGKRRLCNDLCCPRDMRTDTPEEEIPPPPMGPIL